MDTAKLYIRLYPWHPMTPTTHKILIHGPVIIQNAILPIGQLSEEAAEARNKHFRTYRENHSRKCSREACNEDVINRLLLTSDPYLTSIRKIPKKKSRPLLQETLNLLLLPNTISEDEDESEEENEEDDENEDYDESEDEDENIY
ncbi:uncharacterized protein LOC143265943 [Megachile rotundata]|uniref:uncharacterized protein LOC143265943 n=1 Tax=Megachile rotundata TaxID=143995 RepID=UPI003FD1D826